MWSLEALWHLYYWLSKWKVYHLYEGIGINEGGRDKDLRGYQIFMTLTDGSGRNNHYISVAKLLRAYKR